MQLIMRKIESNQRQVKFSFCKSPITIDKSEEWGEGNVQQFPNGVFLKHDPTSDEITHGVQPNENNTAPIGWTKDVKGFKKLPIWVGKELEVGSVTGMETLDGLINYQVTEPSYLCYNDNGNDEPNLGDSWAQTAESLNKNYEI